jgi:hypothetical protein
MVVLCENYVLCLYLLYEFIRSSKSVGMISSFCTLLASPLFTSIALLQMVHTRSAGFEDVGPSGHVEPSPLPTWAKILQQLMGKQNAMDETLRLTVENTTSGRQNHRSLHHNSSYQEFLGTHPPMFTQAEEPLQADEWLNTIEQKLRLLRCTDQHQLQGVAGMCWADYLSTLPKDTRLTWNQFKVAFHDYHIPTGLIEVKTTEFLKLE